MYYVYIYSKEETVKKILKIGMFYLHLYEINGKCMNS